MTIQCFLVKKASDKWRMCLDYIDLNLACPKDSYPFPNIDMLVDNSVDYRLLSFMDMSCWYNQILSQSRKRQNFYDETRQLLIQRHALRLEEHKYNLS